MRSNSCSLDPCLQATLWRCKRVSFWLCFAFRNWIYPRQNMCKFQASECRHRVHFWCRSPSVYLSWSSSSLSTLERTCVSSRFKDTLLWFSSIECVKPASKFAESLFWRLIFFRVWISMLGWFSAHSFVQQTCS